jgi:two-component system response regulator HydG
MARLIAYDLPGNVRELENAIERAVALGSRPLLHAGDLPSNLQNFILQRKSQYLKAAASAHAAPAANVPAITAGVTAAPAPVLESQPVLPLSELERRAIMNALDYTKGDRAVAAHLLGIGRTTLYRKLKEYQLDN